MCLAHLRRLMLPDESPYPELHTAIYFLFGSNGRVRYIGKTVHPRRRAAEHRAGGRRRTHTRHWIMDELRRGHEPVMAVIEWCGDNWSDRERFWIARGRALGWELTNHTIGGEGQVTHSEETRAKISRRRRSRGSHNVSDVTRARMRAAYYRRVERTGIRYYPRSQEGYERFVQRVREASGRPKSRATAASLISGYAARKKTHNDLIRAGVVNGVITASRPKGSFRVSEETRQKMIAAKRPRSAT